jgi:L-alanine-DL-glutamate epimerase-like enolase superfamily enzyme
MRKLTIAAESWPIAGTFTIARGSKTSAEVVTVTLQQDGCRGRGECVPYGRYGETIPQVIEALEAARPAIEAGMTRADLPRHVRLFAARNALDCALWDLEAKLAGKPVWQLAGLPAPAPLTTAFTISLASAQEMAAAAEQARHMPLLKLKLGREGDDERLRLIRRAVPAKRLIVDANEGWSTADLPQLFALSAELGIEMIEQPLPADNDAMLAKVERPVPVCADESAHTAEGLETLVGKYDAVNIKLDKTGGLTGAIAMAARARDLGLDIMLGCMVGTSLAMAPATLLGSMASVVDLDGPLLLSRDREHGITYSNGLMSPPVAALWG